MENLDLRCAELGEQLSTTADEKLLTDALSVLEEQGVYAFFLFLSARGKKPGEEVGNLCKRFLQQTPSGSPLLPDDANTDVFSLLQNLSQDLDNLLFARDLLRQALVYARYHAKAHTARGGGGS